MPQENQSSYVKSTIATVAILGVGALIGYLFSDTNENSSHQHGNGGQNRRLPLPPPPKNASHQEANGGQSGHLSLPPPPERNQPRDRSQECALCYRDINSEPSRTMSCRHRIHQDCWQRMKTMEMTCPTCSDNVFRV